MYVLPGIFPENHKIAKQLLRLLRSFLNLNAYSSFERHTETTVEAIHSELRTWAGEVEVCCFFSCSPFASHTHLPFQKHGKLDKKKKWNNAPKAHMHMHMPQDIMAKGATRHYNTKTFESMHRPLKQFYLWMSNFKNVGPQVCYYCIAHIPQRALTECLLCFQILTADIRSHAATYIRTEIDAYDESLRAIMDKKRADGEAEPDEIDDIAGPRNSYGRVTMRAPTATNGWLFSNFKFSADDTGPYAPLFRNFIFKNELDEFLKVNQRFLPYQTTNPDLRVRIIPFCRVRTVSTLS